MAQEPFRTLLGNNLSQTAHQVTLHTSDGYIAFQTGFFEAKRQHPSDTSPFSAQQRPQCCNVNYSQQCAECKEKRIP